MNWRRTWNVGSWRRIAASDAALFEAFATPVALVATRTIPSREPTAGPRLSGIDSPMPGCLFDERSQDGCVGPMVRALAANFDSARYRVGAATAWRQRRPLPICRNVGPVLEINLNCAL
jgi:hypothetical protein